MQPWWNSVVAVAGTLLGVYLANRFQSKTAQRSLNEARREQRRTEFAEAVATYAAAATALRRAEFDRGKKRLQNATDSEREEARQECYRRRAEANSAYYLVRLFADPQDDDIVQGARKVVDLSRSIVTNTMSEDEMLDRSRAATKALDEVVDAANRRLRELPAF